MNKGSSSAKKRRDASRHNPLAADIEADRMHGVRLKRPLKDTRDEELSDDEREVCYIDIGMIFLGSRGLADRS